MTDHSSNQENTQFSTRELMFEKLAGTVAIWGFVTVELGDNVAHNIVPRSVIQAGLISAYHVMIEKTNAYRQPHNRA